jgi:hypothetical protein
MALSDQVKFPSSIRTALEFSEALRTELRRKVNDSRKVKKISPDSIPATELKRHDEGVILLFLEEEFSLSIINLWQRAKRADPWPELRAWEYPGVATLETDDERELGESVEPLLKRGHHFVISHSGLYTLKIYLEG